jgi:hypothetical protein
MVSSGQGSIYRAGRTPSRSRNIFRRSKSEAIFLFRRIQPETNRDQHPVDDQQWSSIMSRMLSLVLRYYVQAILAAALLVSPDAHAGQSRGLSLATAEAPLPNEARQQAPEPQQTPAKPALDVPPQSTTCARIEPAVVAKLSRRHVSLEARVIHELHRHGIYW